MDKRPSSWQERNPGLGPTGRVIELRPKKEVRQKSEFQIIREGRAKLDVLMKDMARKTNENFTRRGAPEIISEDGRIDMSEFGEESEWDKNEVDRIQREQFDLHTEKGYSRHLEEFTRVHAGKLPEHDSELLDFCRLRQDDSLSNICELVTTALLHRNLGDRYIVVRSSKIDDLREGSDGYIYDTVTSARLCSIDEYTVHDASTREFNGEPQIDERLVKKTARQERIMKKGGAKLKYGFEINKAGSVRLGPVENIPIFIAAINKKDVLRLVETLKADIDEPISQTEREIFERLMNSLLAQAEKFLESCDNPKLKANITTFIDALKSSYSQT